MGQYLIDSNIISKYFSASFSGDIMDFIAGIIDSGPNISVITQIEALSWINPDKGKELLIKEFISNTTILTITPLIIDHCVKLRRSRRMKTPDAIIAATAMAYGLTLVTLDKDFANIPGLSVYGIDG